jgi:hypothetical protein
MTIYNPDTLPKNDNLNRFAYVIDVKEQIFIRKGKMIAFMASCASKPWAAACSTIVRNAFNAPKYVHHFVVAQGQGQLILATTATTWRATTWTTPT